MSKHITNTSRIAIIVGGILLIPLFGTFLVDGWDWGIFDFVIAFVLLFGTGLALSSVAQRVSDPVRRFFAVAAILFVLVLIWAELAVGVFFGE